MDRAFQAGAVVVPPTAPVSPSLGYPTGGSPVGGVPASQPGPWWFHMVMEELRAVITAGGVIPDHTVLNQLLQALPAALASRPELARSMGPTGYLRLLGGGILNWGNVSVASGTPQVVTYPLAFPSAAFIAIGSPGGNNSGNNTTSFIDAINQPNFRINNWSGTTNNWKWFALGQ